MYFKFFYKPKRIIELLINEHTGNSSKRISCKFISRFQKSHGRHDNLRMQQSMEQLVAAAAAETPVTVPVQVANSSDH